MHQAEHRLAELAAAHHGIFTFNDAQKCGLSHGQADRRSSSGWIRLHDGVFRMPGAAPTWNGDLLAACLAAGEPCAVSHRAAAQIYGVPGRREHIEITCRRWLRTQV